MPTKKSVDKKSVEITKTSETKKAKTCDCKECNCDNCCCGHSQVSFYILIAMLVATMTILVISLSFNRSVRDLFRPTTYAYGGRFDSDVEKANKDENGIIILSSGAVIDMINSGESGLLIVGEENCMGCDIFARRVNSYEGDKGTIYRYVAPAENDTDSERVKALIEVEETPDFLYIKDGKVFDRIDDVKDIDDLAIFLEKYNN